MGIIGLRQMEGMSQIFLGKPFVFHLTLSTYQLCDEPTIRIMLYENMWLVSKIIARLVM